MLRRPRESRCCVVFCVQRGCAPFRLTLTSVLGFRVSTLKTEFLPLLSVSFVSENSVVAAVSASLEGVYLPAPALNSPERQAGSHVSSAAERSRLAGEPAGGAAETGRVAGGRPLRG